MPEQHTILGGKVYVYKRPNSTLWQCSSYFAGKNRRTSTKEESLSKAKDYRERDDYGFIQKVRADDRVYFLLAGLGSRATQGCGWYLYRNWSAHVTVSDFAILLKFPGGLDFGQARVIDRETGQPKAND